jgi:hypothetical protein
LASPTGNPDNLVTEIAGDKTILSSSAINTKKDIVKEVVSPVSKVLGLDFDVINTAMKADGTGIDQVLDTVKVNYTPSASGTTTIQVSYISGAVGSTPQTITFSSNNNIVSVNGVTFTNGDLFDTTLTKDIQAWVARTNRCIKTPVAERWKLLQSGVKEFIAEDCKKLWWNNDHTQVFLTGYRAQDIFENEFGDKTFTEDALTEAEYVYTTAKDEIIVKGNAKVYKDDGVTPYQRYYFINLKRDPDSKELKIYGNKYTYQATVASNNYIRYSPYSPGYDTTYSGFAFDIPTQGTRGNHLLQSISYNGINVVSAIVTAPDGSKTYLADRGRDNLSICSKVVNEACTGTAADYINGGLQIIRSDFFDSANDKITSAPTFVNAPTATKPSQIKFLTLGNLPQMTDAQVQNIPMLGTFKVDIKLSNGITLPTQFIPNFGRPKTHSEMMVAKANGTFPTLTKASLLSLWQSTDTTGKIDPYKYIYPFLKDKEGIFDPSGVGKINLAWDGLAQWVRGEGFVDTLSNTFITNNSNVKTTQKELTLACSYLTDKTNERQCLNSQKSEFAFDSYDKSGKYAILYYLELGNYFSDFGSNITTYNFYAIENSD